MKANKTSGENGIVKQEIELGGSSLTNGIENRFILFNRIFSNLENKLGLLKRRSGFKTNDHLQIMKI